MTLLQMGQENEGVCSFIMKNTSASKQLMWLHESERMGVLMRAKDS